MYLRAIGNSFTQNLLKEISILTDQAKLLFRNIQYDEVKGLIVLPVERFKVLTKRRIFSVFITRKYEKNAITQSTITIRNIIKCDVENNIDDPKVTYVTLLFGIKIRNNDIIVCSLEEDRGKTLYSIELKISELDIEISDQKS
jgi:hypothetical protein